MVRVYDTDRWRRLRRLQLSIQPLCWCGKPAGHVDHIVPLGAGGEAWDRGNLQSLCAGCHSLKSNAERKGLGWSGVVGKDGLPRGGDHWWSVQVVETFPQAGDADEWHF